MRTFLRRPYFSGDQPKDKRNNQDKRCFHLMGRGRVPVNPAEYHHGFYQNFPSRAKKEICTKGFEISKGSFVTVTFSGGSSPGESSI